MAAYTKIFVKFADSVRPFWDKSEWFLFVDSEPVDTSPAAGGAPAPPPSGLPEEAAAADAAHVSTDALATDQYIRLRSASAAVRCARKRGDRYTRGYFTVRRVLYSIFPPINLVVLNSVVRVYTVHFKLSSEQ